MKINNTQNQQDFKASFYVVGKFSTTMTDPRTARFFANEACEELGRHCAKYGIPLKIGRDIIQHATPDKALHGDLIVAHAVLTEGDATKFIAKHGSKSRPGTGEIPFDSRIDALDVLRSLDTFKQLKNGAFKQMGLMGGFLSPADSKLRKYFGGIWAKACSLFGIGSH